MERHEGGTVTVDLAGLLAGDEDAFRDLVRAHQATMMRLALLHVRSTADAEEVVQETWLAVLQGIDGFEGRASLRTWICRILLNIARRRAGQESRSVPMSGLPGADGGPSVDPDRFMSSGPNAGHWSVPPRRWGRQPEDLLLAGELRELLGDAVRRLSPGQREVITMRDVEGWTSTEVCELMEISEGHQRVLLHRARSRVRQTVESYLERQSSPAN
ncbi:RNA polymerase sigma factor [Micromonospora profundi]|uniref:RNA polymerase sigma factor n=1 Tax=Micromonospora profundi TaxID=1420889 RepID=UPI0036618554